MSRARILLVMLFCAAFLVPSSSAQAGSAVLCSGYSSCAAKGYSHFGYSTHKSTSYWRMYTGTNCTNYVAYRLVTTNGMPNVRPKSGVGNAKDWGRVMASITDSTPTVGSVAWWGRTGHHVAYVEKVVSSSEIWVSESNWSGAFDWRKITKSGSGWPDGFIHFRDLRLVNKAKPVIEGTVKVGTTLRALVGSWSPSSNTYAYRWRADGDTIAGATSKTFTPTAAQAGKKLSVSVTASRTSYPAVTATSASTTVASGTLKASEPPRISGTARVDSTLSASTGTWAPSGATYAHQWLVDGTPVPGATSATYVPGAADAGRRVSVTVTASKSGYAAATSTSAPTAAIAPGPLSASAKPAISGTAKVGSTLSATPGAWSKPGLTYGYQWHVDGTAVDGATGATYVPRAVDLGLPITVHVTARRDGYEPTTAASAPTAGVVRGALKVTSRPTLTSQHTRVGSRLTATPGTWSPSATYTYQWYADSDAVPGATGATFVPTSRERGATMLVRVTGTKDGYTTKHAYSDRTRAIDHGRVAVTTPPTVTGTLRLGSKVAVDPGRHSPGGATLRYQWLRDGKVIARATHQSRPVTKSDLGHKLSVRVTFSAPGYLGRTVTTAAVGPARAASTLKASADPGRGRVTFTIRLSSSGISDPDGTVTVRFAGHDRSVKVVNGRASLTLKSQPARTREYVFSYRGTSSRTSATYRKTVTIR